MKSLHRVLSTVLDQADDGESVALEISEVRGLITQFKVLNCGVEARPEEEASAEQLAGLRAKLRADVAPYCDFAVWRPYGHRVI